eukprot:9094578-Alexandrium_andersonii.AAC.1
MPPAQTRWNRCPQPGHCSASGAAGPPVSWRQTLQMWGLASILWPRRSARTYSGLQDGHPAAGPRRSQ